MKKYQSSIPVAVWLPVLSIVLGLLLPTTSQAGKPGGGGSGTGTIYFDYEGHVNAMNADGSGKTALPAGVRGSPSRLLHGAKRWFLQTANIGVETYPDGSGYKTNVKALGGTSLHSPCWSPDSADLLYTKDTSGSWNFIYDVYRVGAGGGSQVNLTSDLSFAANAIAWR